MSDDEDNQEEKAFCVDRAKLGRAACKKCKQKCPSGELRLAKLSMNPFGAGKMKNWYHVDCLFEQLLKQRATTKRIESADDIDGWDDLDEEDKDLLLGKIKECNREYYEKHGIKPSPVKTPKKTQKQNDSPKKPENVSDPSPSVSDRNDSTKTPVHKDNLFREFRRLLADLTNNSSYLEKTAIIAKLFKNGTDGTGFKGDIVQWCRLLLPGVVKRIYNLQSKQLIKLFSRIFHVSQDDMLEHFEQGDIGETIQEFFEKSDTVKPSKKSLMTLQEVDDFLEELSKLTKEDEQIRHFKIFITKCTSNDLKTVIRLIKGDLRINAGAKHVLDAVHPDAYEAYQASRDLPSVIKRCLSGLEKGSKNTSIKAKISLMTPVLPMLAEACKSIEQAMKKCPNGMYSEVKYDGERVQVHKKGTEFKYFSRSLKPVQSHKVAHFKNYIPQAFPHGKDLILDSEILLIDTTDGKPLPFGSLGKHKKEEFKNANVCLFIFDCIYYNGDDLTDKPIKHRKKILRDVMTEIPNHIMFAEMEFIENTGQLAKMICKVLTLGLEGLVLKDTKSIYEPGKRHWLKVKKDYLFDGQMADSADLIVLGAWFGTGKKGGMMSIFLMGCYDTRRKKFCTVTKVHTGHDDKTLERLQDELDMIKISSDPTKVPDWLVCTKTMIPDFIARDPKKQPVWEITGAEFTKHDVHTADGISIRFPRVTKIRDDKTWETATTLEELKKLFESSKSNSDISNYLKDFNDGDAGSSSTSSSGSKDKGTPKDNGTPKKRKLSSDSDDDENSKQEDKSEKKLKINSNTRINGVLKDGGGSTKCDILKPLPNLFKDVKLIVEEERKEKFAEWLRYFKAFGGEIMDDEDRTKATHYLHANDTVASIDRSCPREACHIIVEWIQHSITKNELQDVRPYLVRWKPSPSDSET